MIREPRNITRRIASAVLPIAGILIAFVAWQWLATGPLQRSGLPRVPATFDALGGILGQSAFWSSVGGTLLQALVGFALSVAIALPIGLYVGTSLLAYHATKLVIEILKPIPAIVILPLAVLQLGTTGALSIFLVMFSLIPLLIITVAAGARDTDPVRLDAARSYGLGSIARTWRIVVPSALPFVATGLRVSAAFALIIAVLAGLYGGAPGMGHDLDVYRQAGVLETSFAYVVVLGVLGLALNILLTAGERKVLFWHESVRKNVGRNDGAAGDTSRFSAERRRLWAVQDSAGRFVHRVTAVPVVRVVGRALRPRRIPVSEPAWRWTLRGVLILVPVALLAVWWVESASSENPFFPPLSDTVSRFGAIWLNPAAFDNAFPSLRNLVVGFALGSAAGVLAGAVIGQVRWLFTMLNPPISFFRAIPSIAYLPILIAVIGFTAPMRITAITLASFFPVLIAAIDGVRSIDETVVDVTRSYRIPRLITLFSVRLPAATPRIFAGAEIGLVAALIVMVASELIGTSQGIGAQVLLAQQTFQFSDMWAGIVLLAAIGILSNLVFRFVRGRILAWYDGARAASKAQ
ncbi:ABC transporter permease [Amycolatopsis pithecellobii]|nr:ABC transporter permease subunit [Amycolatopsis pithecellobii]